LTTSFELVAIPSILATILFRTSDSVPLSAVGDVLYSIM